MCKVFTASLHRTNTYVACDCARAFNLVDPNPSDIRLVIDRWWNWQQFILILPAALAVPWHTLFQLNVCRWMQCRLDRCVYSHTYTNNPICCIHLHRFPLLTESIRLCTELILFIAFELVELSIWHGSSVQYLRTVLVHLRYSITNIQAAFIYYKQSCVLYIGVAPWVIDVKNVYSYITIVRPRVIRNHADLRYTGPVQHVLDEKKIYTHPYIHRTHLFNSLRPVH